MRTLAAAAVLAAVGSLLFGSILAHPNSRVLADFSDAAMTMRLYDVIDQAGSNPFTYSHDRANGAPEGYPILAAVQIAAPIQSGFVWLTKDALGITGAVNTFLLVGLLLTGVAMFLLLDRCRFGFLPSLFGALLVTFNPWMYERAISGHVAFAHGWVLILLLYTLLRLRERRTVRRALVAGAAYGLCFLMASYSGLLATALVAGFVLVDLVFAGSRVERVWTATLLVAILGVMVLFLVPGAVAYVSEQERVSQSLSRSSAQLDQGRASPLHYVLPSPRHPLVGSLSDRARPFDYFNEKTVFFGYTTLLLAILAAVWLIRERRTESSRSRRHTLAWLALATAPIALVLSFGTKVTIGGLDIPMPGYLIGEVTAFYRIYARLGFVVAIALAILAAFALNRLGRRRWGNLAVAGVIALTAFELLPTRAAAVPIAEAPAHDRWLATQPKGIVAHYPMMTDRLVAEKLAARELYYQRFTGLPLFEIYGPERRGTREDAIRLLARYLTNPDALGILAAEGVRYVVIHDDIYRAQGAVPPAAGPQLRPLRQFGPVRIYELEERPVDLDVALENGAEEIALLWGLEPLALRKGDGFHEGERYGTYQGTWSWMNQGGTLVVENESEAATIQIDGLAFANGEPRRIELRDARGETLATAIVPAFLDSFTLGPFRVPSGTTRLSLASTPGPTPIGDGDTRGATIFVSPLRAVQVPDYSSTLREP